MAYVTLVGEASTDPYFDARSLRPGYYDRYEIAVDMEDREPVKHAALSVSYRAFVTYTDAGDRTITRIELLGYLSPEERRRGRPTPSQALNPYDPAENGLIALLMADAKSKTAQQDIEAEVQRHQADRDEEFA